MDNRINKIKGQIKELNDWKLANNIQQIPFNPPVNTRTIMQDNMLVFTGKTADSSSIVFNILIEVSFDGDKVFIPAILNQ